RNFCNKLWNACRFRQMQGSAGATPAASGAPPDASEIEGEINPALLTSDDKWILLKLDQAIREIDAAFAQYKFSEVTQTLHRFFWGEYCDWYVEAAKAALACAVEPLNRGNVEPGTPPRAHGSDVAQSGGKDDHSTVQRFNGSTHETDPPTANQPAVID